MRIIRTKQELKSGFSEEFEQKVIDNWGDRTQLSNLESYLLSKYLSDPSLNVFEAGTGAGLLSFYLEEFLGFDKITAIDVIPKMIIKAKQKAKEKKSKIFFTISDASNLNCLESNKFHYLVYLQQILSMIPKEHLKNALDSASEIGTKNAIFIFSFLDWNSRWYNPILSFKVNLVRYFTGRKIQKYYLPELKFRDSINIKFFHKDQHGIFWGKKKNIEKQLNNAGFIIKKCYKEEEITKIKGRALYFICEKHHASFDIIK